MCACSAGRPPFEDHNRRRMFYAILHLPPPFPLDFSNELIDVLAGLLEKRPEAKEVTELSEDMQDNAFEKMKKNMGF